MMKTWKIRVYCPYGDEVFAAYAEENPIDNELISWNELAGIYEELWDDYGYIVTDHIDADPEEDEEAYEEEYDQLYEDFMSDSGATAEEMPIEEIKLYTPYGSELEIIYDERNEK